MIRTLFGSANNELNVNNPLDDPDIIHKLSVVATHYAFRNGPVENMHAGEKLSDNAIMKLNKFLVNRFAYIFTLILDDDKMKSIGKYCTNEDIEFKLANVTIEYSFIDGIKNNKIDIEKLDKNDIDIIVEYMEIKLIIVFNLILERNIKMIKDYLLMGIFFGQDWDYAIPESIDFKNFLYMLNNI
ncbi:hypothetical protein [Clostridium sp. Marseille-Q7071]